MNTVIRKLILSFVLIMSCYNGSIAQDFEIEKFELSELNQWDTVSKFGEDNEGNVYLFTLSLNTNNIIIMKFFQGEWIRLESPPCFACYKDATFDSEGNLYLAGGTSGCYKYDGEEWSKISNTNTLGVLKESTGGVALITSQGIGRLVDNEIVLGNNDGFPSFNRIIDVEVSSANEIYILIFNEVYSYHFDNGWTLVEEESNPKGIAINSEGVLCIAESFGNIGTYSNNTYTSNVYPECSISGETRGFGIDSQDYFWAINGAGVSRCNMSDDKFWSKSSLLSEAIFIDILLIDSKDNCWVYNNNNRQVAVIHDGDLYPPVDLDEDGYDSYVDCDDADPTIFPGSSCDDGDLCTENDFYTEDCLCIGESLPTFTYFVDLDQDGFGNPNLTIDHCVEPAPIGSSENNLDCDDTNLNINPNAVDIPGNGIDEDCDGQDAISSTYELNGEQIEIYPNPVSDVLQVTSTIGKSYSVQLFDTKGQLVFKQNEINSIDCSDLRQGTYLLKVIDLQSGEFVVERVMVSH